MAQRSPGVMAQGDELAPWALALTGNQSLRLCRGELHAEDSVAPIGWGGPLASGAWVMSTTKLQPPFVVPSIAVPSRPSRSLWISEIYRPSVLPKRREVHQGSHCSRPICFMYASYGPQTLLPIAKHFLTQVNTAGDVRHREPTRITCFPHTESTEHATKAQTL